MPDALGKDNISTTITEQAYIESNNIFDLQGLGGDCKTEANIGNDNQFYRDCAVSRSDINQASSCKLSYKGNKSNVNREQQGSKETLQKNIVGSLYAKAHNNLCAPNSSDPKCINKTKIIMVPGSHNIENIAQVTDIMSSTIQDTMSGTCSQTTGGVSNFMCVDTKLNSLNVWQGQKNTSIADCVSRNVDVDSISQRANESIQQSSELTIENTLHHIIVMCIFGAGAYFTFKTIMYSMDIVLKVVAMLLIWAVTIFSVYLVNKYNIGGAAATNADLTTPAVCPDCTKYETRSDCHGLGLCTWIPNVVSLDQCTQSSPGIGSLPPASCLSPTDYQQQTYLLEETEGNCTCEPIFDVKTGSTIANCDTQCPNYKNKDQCINANCGWKDIETYYSPAPSMCMKVNNEGDDEFCKEQTDSNCNNTQKIYKDNPFKQCKLVSINKINFAPSPGYCTGDKTHCNPKEIFNYNTNLSNIISM